jgi:pimeloyl-ACP methyl ester carboxylesterase
MSTQPFYIDIDQVVLDDLKYRIWHARWPDAPGLSYLRGLAAYWADDFDWRKTEAAVNTYPQFITEIDGYKIHYLHIKSGNPDAIPVIISHGWPGSFMEMLKVIPLLADFHLVIPSLLGFGFSDKRGGSTPLMAGLWVKLMRQLGYERFIAQGGDFGATISTRMAMQHPQHLIGLHLNYIPFNYRPYFPPGTELPAIPEKTAQFFKAQGAYSQVQATKPAVLSCGLNDSPVGLCAWILEIFKSFSNPSASLDQLFDRDQLLSHITLYWVTQCIYSSMLLYSEKETLDFGPDDFIKVPVGVAKYPFPDSFPEREFVERGYNVVYWKEKEIGGHFAAMEVPEVFAGDLRAFVRGIL